MKNLACIFILFTMILFISCDHTVLTGEIISNKDSIFVGDTIELNLKVPAELDGIYWVHWMVEPEKMGLIEYKQPSENKNENDVLKKYGKEDRKALFILQKAGKVKIFVSGFYKQTNPQGINEREFVIHSKQPK